MVSRSFSLPAPLLSNSLSANRNSIKPIRCPRTPCFSPKFSLSFHQLTLFTAVLFLLSMLPATQANTPFLSQSSHVTQPKDISVYANGPFTYHFSESEFSGLDRNQLTLNAVMQDGSRLPDWINFDPITCTISGNAPHFASSYIIKLNANDGKISTTLLYRILVINLSVDFYEKNFVVAVNKEFSIQLRPTSLISFSDRSIKIQASLANGQSLPNWLQFSPDTLTFSGKPIAPVTEYIRLEISLGASKTEKQIIIRVNPEVFVKTPIPDQVILLNGEPLFWRIPEQTFEGFGLNIVAQPLEMENFPDWIIYNPSGEFLIHPHDDNSQGLTIKVTAMDEANQTAVSIFRIVTRNIQYVMPRLSPRALLNRINFPNIEPKVAAMRIQDKGVFIAWQSNAYKSNTFISAAVVDFSGNNIIPEFHVNELKSEEEGLIVREPKLAQFSNQNILITWETSERALRGKIIDWKNTIIKHQFEIFQPSQNIEYVGAWPFGENMLFLTTVHEARHVIMGHIIDAKGSVFKRNITLVETYSEVISPKLTILPSGNVLLTYIARDFRTKEIAIIAVLLDNELKALQNYVLYSALEWAFKLDTLVLSNGNIMLAWVGTPRIPPTSSKLNAMIIADDLQVVKSKFTVANLKAKQPTFPTLMALHGGEILAIWDSTLVTGAQGTTMNILGDIIQQRVTLYNPKNPGNERAVFVSLGNGHNLAIISQRENYYSNIWTEVLMEKFPQNMVPDLVGRIPDQIVYQGNKFEAILSNFLFVDYDGEPLKVSLSQADRSPLPSFIKYFSWNRSIIIDPADAERGNYLILARAEDPYGAYAETTFAIKITPHPVKYFICLLILAFTGVLIGAYVYRRIQLKRSYNMLQISGSRNSSSVKSSESIKDPTPMTRADIEMLMTFNTDKIPNTFTCPITGELMSDPYVVVTTEGPICHSYEKEALDKWFAGNETDPMTRRKMVSIASNLALKTSIELFVKQITTEDMVNDRGLYLEIDKWIKRRGKSRLANDRNLCHLLERYQEAKAILKQNKELQVIVNFEKTLVF